MPSIEFQLTEDGSHTLYRPDLDETYHSTHGSVQESQLIFIQYGLLECALPEIHLFEVGFGTGLNAFLTLTKATELKIKVHYHAVEFYPVPISQALQLNYPSIVSAGKKEAFELLHQSVWGEAVKINDYFTLTKIKADFTQMQLQGPFDLIYFDAFGPDKQNEMWSVAGFEKLYQAANPGAIITTYSAKGVVRRAMQQVGFKVERLAGPPGKREVLRGSKSK